MFNRLRRFRILAALASFLFLALVAPAFAQDAPSASAEIVITDPTGGFLSAIPGGIYIYGLLVMVAGLVSIFVRDSAMPSLLSKVVNFLAMNGGRARNDPSANE